MNKQKLLLVVMQNIIHSHNKQIWGSFIQSVYFSIYIPALKYPFKWTVLNRDSTKVLSTPKPRLYFVFKHQTLDIHERLLNFMLALDQNSSSCLWNFRSHVTQFFSLLVFICIYSYLQLKVINDFNLYSVSGCPKGYIRLSVY